MITSNIESIFGLLREFCHRFNIDWFMEMDGNMFVLTLEYEPPNGKPWDISIQSYKVRDCVIDAIAIAWSNLHSVRTKNDKVISLDDWKNHL